MTQPIYNQDSIKTIYPQWVGTSKAKDITGQIFGELTVLYRYYLNSNAQKAKWVCLCSCGEVVVVLSGSLSNGRTRSCGHIHTQQLQERNKTPIEEILKKKYGNLTPIKELSMIQRNNRNYRVILCSCDCGGTKEALLEQLEAGDTSSCGCIVSKGEEKIIEILKSFNIKYERQVSFKDLKNINLLKFDIAFHTVKNKLILIEYQGRQHYDKNSKFYSEDGVYRDNLKKEYCLKNNILLLLFNDSHSREEITEKVKEIYND